MIGKLFVGSAVALTSFVGWQGATATEVAADGPDATAVADAIAQQLPDDADHVEHCAVDDRGRPFACLYVDRDPGSYRTVEVCLREPRHGPALVTPKWACARSQEVVAPIEESARQFDAWFCNFEPHVGCSDYDETRSDVMLLVDFFEDLAFDTINGPL